ncbi:MAG TPA: hypothetical protein VFJ96_00080 [Gemmatimonadaceae bacterium]|nr:hypothetical protein [Gemmatimonadaceae bacterium]
MQILILVGVVLGSAVGIAGAVQQPRHSLLLTGEDWRSWNLDEKERYLNGFLAGAAAEQARAAAVRAGDAQDSSAVSSNAAWTLHANASLQFRFAPSVYEAQLDDFYWWTNHRDLPILDVMIGINRAMLQQQSDGNP